LEAHEVERILNELVIDLHQELVAFKCAEPLNPSSLLVLEGGVVGEAIDFIMLLIRLAVVVLLLHLHLLLLLGLHRCRLFVESCRFHF